jgi:eukaryotic-like serine/threonine-protein kinase
MGDTDANAGSAPGALSELIARVARLPPTEDEAWSIPLRSGETVGRYEIVREIARGGFGVVYEALDRKLGRGVAVKTVRPGRVLTRDGGASWLEDEAEAIASLSHPGIVAVHDVGEANGAPYVVMELLRGETLEARLERASLSVEAALKIACEIACALAYAHGRGVVHRDLKPANVFLCEDGTTKLLDFGLSHVFGHTGGPRGGGTPAYLAPERWRNEPEDTRSDLFSLGVVIYEMLTGRRPYEATDRYSAVLDAGPPPPLGLRRVPRRLAALVASALAKDPDGRPAKTSEFRDELAAVEREVHARPRRIARMAVVAVSAVAVLAITGSVLRARPPVRVAPGERVAVSVADFVNETGEPALDGLSGLVTTSLEQSRNLAVLTRSRMIDLLRQVGGADAPRIDERLAREIGRRAGVHAVLLGSIRRFDRTYRLDLRAIDPEQDRYLFAVAEQGQGRERIPELIDRLSTRVREALREQAADIRSSSVKVAEAVTPNLEAYQHYFLGLDCVQRPSRYPDYPRGCLAEFWKAVRIDPAFALAWFQISFTGWDELLPAQADRSDAIAEALRHADRLPPREHALLRAWAAHVAGRDDEAIALSREIVASFPDDKQAAYVAGDLAFHRDHFAAAVPYLERVLELDPSFDFAVDHLSSSLLALGRRDALERWGRVWSSMAPTPVVLRALVRCRLGAGDAPGAIAAARDAVARGPAPYALFALTWALSSSGDYSALESELRARDPGLPPRLRYVRAHALAALGHRAEALRMIDALGQSASDEEGARDVHLIRALHLAGDDDPTALWAEAKALLQVDPHNAGLLAPYLARLGDLPHARELAAHVEPGSATHELYVATDEWRSGQPDVARARLKALETREPLPPNAQLPPSFIRAEIAADEGLDDEAVEALRAFHRLAWQGGSARSWAYPRSLFLLARSLERLGKYDESHAEIARLLALWSRADRGLPLLEQARALQARLDAARAAAPEAPPEGSNPR